MSKRDYTDDTKEFFICQSPVTKLWYVRRGDEILDERETKAGAKMALRRRETQYGVSND